MTNPEPGGGAWHFNINDLSQGIARELGQGIRTRIFCGDQAMLSVVRLDPGSVGQIHSHPQEQWGMVLEGDCVRIQGGEEVHMAQGDFWHTPGGVAHGIRAGDRGTVVLDVFSPPREEYTRSGSGFGV